MLHLKDKNKINSDAFKKKHTFKAFSDILSFIDEEDLTEDKFEAVKATFYATLSEDDKTQFLNYQLLKLTFELSPNQLLILKACYKMYITGRWQTELSTSYDSWMKTITKEIGHDVYPLVSREDEYLVNQQLITPPTNSDKSDINFKNARLNSLGIALYERLEKYTFDNLTK